MLDLFTGYRFTDYLAVHLGYTDLGKVESRLAEAVRDSFQVPESGSQQTIRAVDIGMQLWTVGTLYRFSVY